MHWWHQIVQLFFLSQLPVLDCPHGLTLTTCWCSSLYPRPNSSAPEIRCPWSLALARVMPYWEAITRCDRARSALQECGFACHNLEQRTKNPQKKNHNSRVPASTQGAERQAPVMIILWNSFVFGTQTPVRSVLWESFSHMREEFPI